MDFKKVGKVQEAHGLKGELYILIFSKEIFWLPRLKSCLIDSSTLTEKLELKIESARKHRDGFILKSSQIVDRNTSEKWIHADFLIPSELLISKPGEVIYLGEILNFEVLDGGKSVGSIQGFSSNGPQDILVVSKEGFSKKIEILFVDAFLEKIDFNTKQVFMNLPEGLIEANEESLKKEDRKKGEA